MPWGGCVGAYQLQMEGVEEKKAGVVGVLPQHIAAQQHIDGFGLLRGQRVQRISVTPSARLQLVPLTKALGPTPL